MVKNRPMDSTVAEFWKVFSMPAPAPRWSGGRLFMTAAWLGEKNRPMPDREQEDEQREPDVAEVDRQQLQQQERDPGHDQARPWRTAGPRSGPTATPASGPTIRNPIVSGTMAMPAHSGVWLKL